MVFCGFLCGAEAAVICLNVDPGQKIVNGLSVSLYRVTLAVFWAALYSALHGNFGWRFMAFYKSSTQASSLRGKKWGKG